MDWRWELLDAQLRPITAPDVVPEDRRFPSQSDAESWLGEHWPALRAAHVAAVSLRQGDRVVYGPMGLHPPR